MFKKIILIVLMVLIGLIGPVFSQEEKKNETMIIFRHDFMSRYVFYPFGIDFVPNNNMFNMLGAGIYKEGKFFIYNYGGKSKNYVEGGFIFDYMINLADKIHSKTTFFGSSWKFLEEEEGEYGVMLAEEISLQAHPNPSIGYVYLWVSKTKELIGHFFHIGITDNLESAKWLKVRWLKNLSWELKIGYNKGFCVENAEGFTLLLGLSKRMRWVDTLFTDFSIRYYLNDKKINENEIVFGISTSIVF